MNHLTVGILGGSFNPITTGHLHIANDALTTALDKNYNAILDEIWLLPCAGHTFGKELLPAEERIKMIELMFGNLSKYRICKYEILNNSKGSTYETLTELNTALRGFPIDFYYIIGSDNTQTMHKWVNYEKLIDEFKFMVMPRPGYEIADWVYDGKHIVLGKQTMRDISSTKVRTLAGAGDYKKMRQYVHPDVADYIEEKGFYRQSPVDTFK